MFEWDWIDELDARQAADELARSHELVLTAEAGEFLLAAHWADLHAPNYVEECRASLPGMPGATRIAADGCPEIDEFAGAELGALVHRSTAGGEKMVRDALLVRHRHPLLWQGIRAGELRVWMAVKVAERCATTDLSIEQAHWVDARTTPYATSLPPSRFFALVEATIIQVDPDAAEERDRARALARSVHLGRSDEHGMRTLVARAAAGEIAYVAAVIDRIAVILADQGDPDPMDARRATALRILANPARALAMLMGAAVESLHPDLQTSTLGTEEQAELLEGAYSDADGRWTPPEHRGVPVQPEPEQALLPPWHVLRDLLDQLSAFDAGALDPVHVVHVHLSEAALRTGRGVARVEDLGPVTLSMVRDWLSHPTAPDHVGSRIRLRPVLDAEAVLPVDRYEIPDEMAELIATRLPFEVFPFGTLNARKADKDHVRPYRRGGPPGQTSLDNLGPLGRRHHRIKTHGGWLLVRPRPGVFWWRTQHGHWFRVDAHGTHHHGRDTALDERWAPAPAADAAA